MHAQSQTRSKPKNTPALRTTAKVAETIFEQLVEQGEVSLVLYPQGLKVLRKFMAEAKRTYNRLNHEAPITDRVCSEVEELTDGSGKIKITYTWLRLKNQDQVGRLKNANAIKALYDAGLELLPPDPDKATREAAELNKFGEEF